MGEDRRQGDRRVGPSDRRKTYVTLTNFITTIALVSIILLGIILLVYNNLNNKINELNYSESDYYYDESSEDIDLIDEIDITDNSDITDDSDITVTNTNSIETTTNQ